MLRLVSPRLLLRSRAGASLQAFRTAPMSTVPSWATVDPYTMSGDAPGQGANLINGQWSSATASSKAVVDPMNGEEFFNYPNLSLEEAKPLVDQMLAVPKSGLHNPLKNPNRYLELGNMCQAVADEMTKPEVEQFFAKLIQRVVPKSDAQCTGEVAAVRQWIASFGGDQVRMLASSEALPGDHFGQETRSYRWPYGRVGVVTPFNFPLEIPALQSMSAQFMGNLPFVKVDEKVAVVYEQFLRLLIHCGCPAEHYTFAYTDGPTTNQILIDFDCRVLLFTGSQGVAEKLCRDLHGKVKLEDAGFNWKIFGPDAQDQDYVAWQCDQDAYALAGQKCSAESILFIHENWEAEKFVSKMGERAATRSLEDMTNVPVLTWSNVQIQAHVDNILKIPGSKVSFGGKPITGDLAAKVPEQYGTFEPTAVWVPIEEVLNRDNFDTISLELFGPVQVVTEYKDEHLDDILALFEEMDDHLTASVVSNDPAFTNKVLANTINGTTYAGIRARNTGAPVQHWFGPAGDPRAGGIHTKDAIRYVYSCHREIINDQVVPGEWVTPKAT